jgi:hypothetical protein
LTVSKGTVCFFAFVIALLVLSPFFGLGQWPWPHSR